MPKCTMLTQRLHENITTLAQHILLQLTCWINGEPLCTYIQIAHTFGLQSVCRCCSARGRKKSFQPYQVIIINLASTNVCSKRCVWSNKDLSNCMHLVCFDIKEVLIKTKSASYFIEPLTTRTVHFFYPLPNCTFTTFMIDILIFKIYIYNR